MSDCTPNGLDLPNEVLLEIFLFIPYNQSIPLSLTCKKYNDIISSNIFWKLQCRINKKLETYLNQIWTGVDVSENLLDWKRTFQEYINICGHTRIDGIGIELNPDFESDGYRHKCVCKTSSLGLSRGKFSRGKWYFEISLVKRTSAMSIGFCYPETKINSDSEYRLGFFGMYHGGISRMFVSFATRVKRTPFNEDGMMDGDHIGVMVDLENYKSIAYSIKKSEIDPKKPTVRKIYFVCDLVKEAARSRRSKYQLRETDECISRWYNNILERKEIVVSSIIWLHRKGNCVLFNDPLPVSQTFVDSFKLSSEENILFEDISELQDYSDEYFK